MAKGMLVRDLINSLKNYDPNSRCMVWVGDSVGFAGLYLDGQGDDPEDPIEFSIVEFNISDSMTKTIEFEERDVSELENDVSSNYKCEDCGHIGDTYKQSERVVNSNAPDKGWKVLHVSQELTEDDDVAVLCPKCLSWFYFFKKGGSDASKQ